MTSPHVASASFTGLTAAETAVVTTAPVNATPTGGEGNLISGFVTFTGNASASTAVIKVRQGSGTSGTTVYTSPALTVAAAQVVGLPFMCQDVSAESAGVAQYTVTVTPSATPGASGAGTAVVSVQVSEDAD